MKNKKILYILTFIITFFTFNLNVDAAEVLICVYEKGSMDGKFMLKQDSYGNKTLYHSNNNITMHDSGWTAQPGFKFEFVGVNNINEWLDSNTGALLKCPPYSNKTWGDTFQMFDREPDGVFTPSQKLEVNPVSGSLNLIGATTGELTCENLFGGDGGQELLGLIRTAFTLVKIAIPVLLIGLGTMDFAKAIFAGKEDEMKKAQDKFMKRIAIGIGVFLVPTILKLILTVANGIWSNISPDFCGII